MRNGTGSFTDMRGQRTDLHIANIRQGLESSYGPLFADAVALRRRLEDPSLSQAEYDAAVVGLVGSTIITVRPMPSHLQGTIGGLLGLVDEDRSMLVKTITPSGREIELRADRLWLNCVVTALGICLYPGGAHVAGLTDSGCGLEVLSTSILAEADANGVISPQAVGRLHEKLAAYKADVGDSAPSGDRRAELATLVERAFSTGSALICIPSQVREERLSCAGLVPILTAH